MRYCFKCGKSEEEVKLLDVIFKDEIVNICEECVLNEDSPIIRRPSTNQLKESERNFTVRERLLRIQGMKEEKEDIRLLAKKITNITLDDLRKRTKTKAQELEEKQELAKKKNKPLNLVDNYNWLILMARKKKKMTRHELAQLLGESETAIKMLENKEFPDDADRLINKIEQYFSIKLRKEDTFVRIEEQVKEKLGKNLKVEKKEIKEPARILKFDKKSVENITIADLQKMKEEKERKEKDILEKKSKDMRKDVNAESLLDDVKGEEREGWEEETKTSFLGDDIELD